MLLAFTFLYDPLTAILPGMSNYWLWLVLPLLLAISIVYKGTRVEDLRRLPGQSLIMTFQILMVMAAAAVLLDGLYWFMTRVV
jgi:hypothetical protein